MTEGAHLLFSIHTITFRLSPSAFAASNSLLCVPFNTCLWSTKLSNTSRPCARNSSSLSLVFWIKLCSSSACICLCEKPLCVAEARKGDSEMVSVLCGRRAGCSVDWLGECVVWNRLRASEGEARGAAPEMSSDRWATAC